MPSLQIDYHVCWITLYIFFCLQFLLQFLIFPFTCMLRCLSQSNVTLLFFSIASRYIAVTRLRCCHSLGVKQRLLWCDQVNTVVFDKTGTVTYGVPHIADVLLLTADKSTNALHRLLAIVGTAESCSEHPMAGAIVKYAKSVSLIMQMLCEFWQMFLVCFWSSDIVASIKIVC